MNAHLMYRNAGFAVPGEFPFEKTLLLNDLELNVILDAMAQGDESIRNSCCAALLNYCTEKTDITYRQDILKDLLENEAFARELYGIAVETIHRRKTEHVWLQSQMNALFRGAVEILRMTVEEMRKLRTLAEQNKGKFRSEGLCALVDMLIDQLGEAYLTEVAGHLEELSFNDGMLISARFGEKLQGERYTMRRPEKPGMRTKLRWMNTPSITISAKDEDGLKDLDVRKARVISENVNTLAQATDHVMAFFTSLRDEMGFYVGCLNLKKTLEEKGQFVCMPTIAESGRRRVFSELYDCSLPLIGVHPVIGNTMDYADKTLFVITGANQGGKSTFLRSFGQSQLMLQTGMFVCAASYTAHITGGLFTHFRKEEDSKMDSGKLDEELERMSRITDAIRPNSTVLFNESFAATNEREGAEIGRQITQALLDSGNEVFAVTHLFAFSDPFWTKHDPAYVFLRAERLSDGQRSFRLSEGEPQRTGYGDDVYETVFGND